MPFLSWRDEYQVGVPLIDAEHRYLFALINEFHDDYANGRTPQQILSVLNRLVAYAETHFQHEEALMEKSGYPRLADQQRQHEKLYSSIYALNEKLSSDAAKVSAATLQFLKSWMVGHIVQEDMDIGHFLQSKAIQAAKSARKQSQEKAEKTARPEAAKEGARPEKVVG